MVGVLLWMKKLGIKFYRVLKCGVGNHSWDKGKWYNNRVVRDCENCEERQQHSTMYGWIEPDELRAK